MSTWSGKIERAVSGSAAIGGGGSTAADGMTLIAAAAASIKSVVPRMSPARLMRLLPFIVLLLSGWMVALTLGRREPADYGGGRRERRRLPSRFAGVLGT